MQACYFLVSVSKCFLLVVVAKHECQKKNVAISAYTYWRLTLPYIYNEIVRGFSLLTGDDCENSLHRSPGRLLLP
jgi:hypothetical protein